ncbi:MAG: hypothetical protein A2W19_12845 [Spirochaetes bacterium RBG_16_49_21]|nr:MAG: hypothetical protein A2W19_12845 [Spirochaetes bacterium RBG_16_49_21]
MKKLLPLSLVLFLGTASGVYTQERADLVEAFTPSSAMLFVKTSPLKKLVESANFAAGNILSRDLADALKKKREEFKSKTGVDPLDVESLKKAGIDAERSASLALYPPVGSHEDRAVLFIPVKDEKTFPLKFVEILKKMSNSEKLDLYPVITEYRNHAVFQIQKDIFTTAFDGVFMLASTGELIQLVIDVKENNSGYLSLDPLYMDYTGKTAKNYDLRAFATRDFLKQALRFRKKINDRLREREKKPEPEKSKGEAGPYTLGTMSFQLIYAAATGGDGTLKKSEPDFSAGPSVFNSVEYASLGVKVKPTDVAVDLAVKFNNTSTRVNTFLDVIKTGMSDKAIYVNNAAAYAFVSVDFNKLEELCKSPGAECAYYAEFKNKMRTELGIDLSTDFIPYYSGVVNIIAGQPKGAGGGYLIYLPLNDPGRGKKLWDTIAAYLKDKFKGTGRFGTAKIGAADSFWYIDSKDSKIYLVCDVRGLYIGNDTGLVAAALSGRPMKEAPSGDLLVKKLDGNVFSLAYARKESLFGALITLFAYRHKEISRLAEGMADIYMVGKKLDFYVSIDTVINLMERK